MRPQLILWIPGGVLKSGFPGSDGEPGCGFSWALGGHPGGAPRLPGSAWRAGQNVTLAFLPSCSLKLSFRFFLFSFQHLIRGERERSPPLPEIMQSRFPHLGNSHGSAKHGVQWLSLAVGEPTFLIMVSPLPGKYELYMPVVEEGPHTRASHTDGSYPSALAMPL